MTPEPTPSSQAIAVCLVEYNPLAARYLEQLLSRQPGVRLLPHDDLLNSKRPPKLGAAVFVLDRGTLPTPLSAFLRSLRVRFPDAKVLLLGQALSQPELFRLLFLGIQGFLPYAQVEAQLPDAVRALAQGELWLEPAVLDDYIRYSSQFRSRAGRGDPLTPYERRIIELVRRRLSNREIGSILRINEALVKFHLSNIFAKLGVSDRQAVADLADTQPNPKLLPKESD